MAEDTKNRILETALSRRSWMSTSTASSQEWKKNIKSREHGKFHMEEEDIMDAIIYTTNTGSTERYARLLSHETGLPAYSAAEAGKYVSAGALLIIIAAVAAPIAKTQRAREVWFYVMSGGAVMKIVTMELARIFMK